MSLLTDYRASNVKKTAGVFGQICESVENFLVQNGICRKTNYNKDEAGIQVAVESMENYNMQTFGSAVGFNKIESLVDSVSGIAPEHRDAAIEHVCNIIGNVVGANGNYAAVWQRQSTKQTNYSAEAIANARYGSTISKTLESYLPGDAANALRSEPTMKAALEHFGVDTDKVVPDLKVSISVALMRFHRAVLPYLVPNRTTDSPNVLYKRSDIYIYEVDNPKGKAAPIINMYKDATIISNSLKQIVPLSANEVDASGNALSADKKLLVADGVIKPAVHCNILELSTKTDKYGYTAIGYTDLIAEGARFSKIFVTISTAKMYDVDGSSVIDNTDTNKGSNSFVIEIPTFAGRLTRPTEGESSMRQAMFEHTAVITKNTTTINASYEKTSTANTIFAGLPDAVEAVALKFNISSQINVKNGDVFSTINVTAYAYDPNGSPSATLTALISSIAASGGVKIVGYNIDAKHDEQNLRKSNIAVRTSFRTYSYDIPVGRNFLYDWALGTTQEEISSQLSDIIAIGMDDRGFKMIRKCTDNIASELAAEATSPNKEDRLLAGEFVAGAKINPYVWSGTLDISKIQTIRTADRPGDIAQYCNTFLTRATERVATKTFLNYQLGVNSTIKFAALTSLSVLANILGQPHIHQSLAINNGEQGAIQKTPYRIVLNNGFIIEFYVHTFDMVQDHITIIPQVDGDANNDLNFGHNWDYGTVVGQFTYTGAENFNRIYANSRELPIFTCPIALEIDVTGIPAITQAFDAMESAPAAITTTYVKLV